MLLPRTEQVEQTIAQLLERRPTGTDPATRAVLDLLARGGLLRSEQATAALDPPVAVLGTLGTCGARGTPRIEPLIEQSALRLVPAPQEAAVVIVLSTGELDRGRLDPLVRDRTTHLVVRLVDGGAVLGPFVRPGVTACLRCVDAHALERDPDHVAVTARYVRATRLARGDGVPDTDPALATIALAWAVRDVAAHLDGREPSTWSRTLHLGADPAQHAEQSWQRHPRCGCSWLTDLMPIRPEPDDPCPDRVP